MTNRPLPRLPIVVALLGACAPAEPPPEAALVDLMRVEDARPTGEDIQPLLAALEDPDPVVRAVAVRALGRLERTESLDAVVATVEAGPVEVRVAGFDAVAQMGYGRAEPRVVEMLNRWAMELGPTLSPVERGALAHALGRSWVLEMEDVGRRVETLIALAGTDPESTDGVLLGLFDLSLRTNRSTEFRDAVAEWVEGRRTGPTPRIRALAGTILVSIGVASEEALSAMAADPESAVRRAAAQGLSDPGRLADLAGDSDYTVRVAALQRLQNWPAMACAAAGRAIQDPSHHVRTAAVLMLGRTCEPDPSVVTTLTGIVDGGAAAPDRDALLPATALRVLADVDPSMVGERLPGFVAHPGPFVRARAAGVARALGDVDALRALMEDEVPNVRTAAATGLADVAGRNADSLLVAQLASDDAQLVLTVARLLEDSNDPGILPAAFDALDRFSAERRETFRDARVAALGLLHSRGGEANAPRLEPYLTDYDPVVADLAADALRAWTGEDHMAAPTAPDLVPFPDVDEFLELRDSEVVLEMAFGGEVRIRLLPDVAPTNAARFARLAADGYFDGLTFHRVVTNFIIQGGSPGANEYFGDGPYTRDEIGPNGHWRGTVGLSTRGRDTGDGQIFVNTVDNLRLDHNYTIFGVVTAGMDVVDAVREGDVIERARVVRR